MKKFFVLSSWSRIAAIGSIFMVAFLAACGDSSSASAENSEPAALSSAEKQGSSSSSRHCEECNDEAISSNAKVTESAEVTSSSSDKTSVSSSSSADDDVCSVLLEELFWNWDVPKECYFNPDIDYGTMTDERDGKVYRTVKIGEQTWMAENLNYDDSVATPSLLGNSWCYEKERYKNDPRNCDVIGRLYTWAAAIDSVKLATDAENPLDCGYNKECVLPDTVQGICPEGWHLPNNTEWEALFAAVGGIHMSGDWGLIGGKLMSRVGWAGRVVVPSVGMERTDAYGFSALPAGTGRGGGGFHDIGDYAYFWSSTQTYSTIKADYLLLHYNSPTVKLYSEFKYEGHSVRCVKD